MKKRFDESRRRFLARHGMGMVWLSAVGLAACGGGNESDADAASDSGNTPGAGDGTGGSGGGAVSASERAGTLDAVRAAVARLSAGSDGFDSNALASELQTLPAIAAVGVSASVGNVWARFADGHWLVVPNNLRGAPPLANGRAQALQAGRERPAALEDEDDTPAILVARQYRQLDMLGRVPVGTTIDAEHLCLGFVDGDTLPKLRRMAVGRGFLLPEIQLAQPVDVGIDNGVRGLADVRGDGVFFISAQAAQAGDEGSVRTLICTDTAASEANRAAFEEDLARGTMAYAVTLRGVDGAWQACSCLAISAAFVAARGWRFPTESIGIFNLSGAPSLSDWIPVLNEAGLRHILGWRAPASWERMLAFADDLIQLNLATNNLEGRSRYQQPEPRLRAYGMGETLSHLEQRGITGGTDATFYLQERQAPWVVNALLPTIGYALIREGKLEFELVGQFGQRAFTDDVQPRIAVANTEGPPFTEPLLWRAADPPLPGTNALQDPLWLGGRMKTVLNEDDLARGGYVQVFNGGRCSNVVPITHWEIPIDAVITIDELTLTLNLTIRLRADVHGWRLEPDGYPRDPLSYTTLECSVHSSARFSASGRIARFDAATRTQTAIEWLGSGSLRNVIGRPFVGLSGQLYWDILQLSPMSITAGGGAAHQQRTVVEQFDINGVLTRRSESTTDVPVELAASGSGLQGELKMTFDNDWNLQAGQFEALPVETDLLPELQRRTKRTRLSWPSVRPDFAPRRDFGGT